LVKGDFIAQSTQPEKDILSVLLRFTTLSAWKIWEQDAQSQLFVLRFITDKLKNDYPRVTVQMFEAAIMEGVVSKRGYERSATTLFQMLEDWLIDHSAEIYDARRAPGDDGPKLAERTESQKRIDRLDLVRMLFDGFRNGDAFLVGWSSCFEFLKEHGIIVKGDPILADIWKGIHVKNKAELLEQVRTTPREDRLSLRLHLDNFESRMNEDDYQLKALTQYHEAVCRHFFTSDADKIEGLLK